MQLPDEIGIMVLPETVLFPHSVQPLHIFEPRYRQMLLEALMGSRMFAVISQGEHNVPVSSGIAGVGYVRTAVQNSDGTSNILLQGYSRVVFEDYTQISPYYKGRPRQLEESHEDKEDNEILARHLVSKILEIKETKQAIKGDVKEFLNKITDFHMLADIIAGTLVRNHLNRQRLLEMTTLSERLPFLVDSLRDEYSI
ncbi:MAG: LON peptidase substrate-binding domain-containing protein [Verrucomicrobiota bacterium]